MLSVDKICDVFEQELRLCRPKEGLVDYEAFRACIANALITGILIYPKNEQELMEEAHDIIQGDYIRDFRTSNGVEFNAETRFKYTPPTYCGTALTYNVKDALSSDEDISTIAKKIVNRLNDFDKKKWNKIKLEINLSLEKGASIYKIDEYFERLLSEIQKTNGVSVDVLVNFGEEKLGKDDVRYLLDDSEIINLVKLQEKIHKLGTGQLLFRELPYGDCWNLTQVIKANNCIQDIAQTIKENKLSPFEALLFICTWAQKNIEYYYADVDVNDENTNTIVAAVNNQKIRCVGFSQFITAVVKRLGVDYLQDDNVLMANGTIAVAYEKSEWRKVKKFFCSDHCQLKCYIVDKKYNIDGEVIADALGFAGYGIDLRKIDGDITFLAKSPIATFSRLKSRNKQYKIYSGDLENSEIDVGGLFFTKIHVDGKSQRQVLKETKINSRVAKTLQQRGIPSRLYTQAYGKIIPLIFPELKHGDIIAPIPTFLDDEKKSYEVDKTISISQNEIRNFWMKKIEDIDNKDKHKKIKEENEERIL